MKYLDNIEKDISKGIITSKVLTSRFKFLNENDKKSIIYNDPFYIPFFYHLGKHINPTCFFEMGFDLSLISSCFLKSCKSVEYFLALQQKTKDSYNEKLAISNLKTNYKKDFNYYCGNFFDQEFLDYFDKKDFDLIIVNAQGGYDDLFSAVEYAYMRLKNKGHLVFNNLSANKNKEIFLNIAIGYKKEYKVLGTKYSVGILEK